MRLVERLPLQWEASRLGFKELRLQIMRRGAQLANKKVIRKVENELADFLLIFSLAVKSGASVSATIEYLALSSSGAISIEIQRIVADMEYGANLIRELVDLASRLPSPRIEEMVQTLVANLELGVAISDSLFEQSKSASEDFAQRLAKKAASNETRMLVPTIFLILPVTVLFAIFPSLVMLTSNI